MYPKLEATLREGASVTRASLQRLRSLLLSIHPPNVRAAGLNDALADLVAPLEQKGIHVELDAAQPLDLEPETETLVFRAAREAIRNVAEHAGAEHVTVRVQPANGSVLLTVDDDGVGFDPERREQRRSEGHVGLSLLEELALHEEARIEIRSRPGRGTSFSLEVPV